MSLSGWVRLHRKLLDSAIFTSLSATDLKVFLACLCLANNRPRRWFNGQLEEEIPRGSFVTSQIKLAEQTRLTRKHIRGALDRLQKIGSIWAKPRAKHSTLITVVNFEAYQGDADEPGQESGHRRANGGPTPGHNVRSREGKKKDIRARQACAPEGFEAFWTAYPKKADKLRARRAWAKLAPRDGLVKTILGDVERRARSRAWTKDDGEFIPHPATYLNGHRWEDELEPASAPEPWEREPIYSDADFDATGAPKPEAAAREQARIAGLRGGQP